MRRTWGSGSPLSGSSRSVQRATLTGPASWIECVIFSLDGHLLASASGDHVVKVWGLR